MGFQGFLSEELKVFKHMASHDSAFDEDLTTEACIRDGSPPLWVSHDYVGDGANYVEHSYHHDNDVGKIKL